VAVSRELTLDARALRADFPILERPMGGKPLAYLDSSNSSQKPRQVMDAERSYYETSYANVHRALYELGEKATAGYEGARETVRAYLNAETTREIVFTRGATEALNLVAYAWGLDNLGPGDVVVSTELEHHSNFVPWQYIAGRTGAEFAVIRASEQGELELEGLDGLAARGRVKVVAVGYVNNSLGTVNPVERVAAWAASATMIAPCSCAQTESRSTSLMVPSEFETTPVATTLTAPSLAIASSASSRSSPASSSGIIRKPAPVRFAMYCQGTKFE